MTRAGTADPVALTSALEAVVRANAALVRQLSAQAGIHENALRALVLIDDTGYSTPTEVAGYLGLTSGAVTNLVDRTAAAGLVARAPNPHDRRGSILRLTTEGTAVVRGYRQRYATLLTAVDAAHDGDLVTLLSDLATSLYEQAGDTEG